MKGQTAGAGQNIFNCGFRSPPPPGKVCDVDMRAWEPCIEENHFSFHKSSPCIFLKLNSKSNGVEGSEWARAPPPTGSIGDRIAKIFYDPSDGSILGRTPKRWGIAVVFYAVFYAVLALLFSLCMGGLFLTLDDNKPSFILDSSLIGANPGVAFRPRPADGVLVKITDDASSDSYVKELQEFLAPYKNESWFTSKRGCSADDNYGYPDAPCFFIKLNKIYGWKPEFYELNSLPSDMDSNLVEYITALSPNEIASYFLDYGYIYFCSSFLTSVSRSGSLAGGELNETKIEYPWGRWVSGRFYPFLNQAGYNSPLIPIKVTPPSTYIVHYSRDNYQQFFDM
ncbi:Sodium/potassium-transporting ATPase subunit beta-1 [Papilio machaon]|uniref:Sodium/potassium-transporting ATPase subunit beta-1 n=1 Tax=Papilio machaon TaxID=76193 RepID=A0A194R6I1_PAPMA|nr:Sodium/potassium-transporting ATPase subunit beta-1 [Papilio machaon]